MPKTEEDEEENDEERPKKKRTKIGMVTSIRKSGHFQVNSRVDEVEGDVSEIKKNFTKLLEAAANPEPRRSNGLNQASDEIAMVPPDAVVEEDNPPPPEVPELIG
jgi:hypothetical protein